MQCLYLCFHIGDAADFITATFAAAAATVFVGQLVGFILLVGGGLLQLCRLCQQVVVLLQFLFVGVEDRGHCSGQYSVVLAVPLGLCGGVDKTSVHAATA